MTYPVTTVRHTVRIPLDLDQKLRLYADEHDVTMNSVWTEALSDFLAPDSPPPPPNANAVMAKVSFG